MGNQSSSFRFAFCVLYMSCALLMHMVCKPNHGLYVYMSVFTVHVSKCMVSTPSNTLFANLVYDQQSVHINLPLARIFPGREKTFMSEYGQRSQALAFAKQCRKAWTFETVLCNAQTTSVGLLEYFFLHETYK